MQYIPTLQWHDSFYLPQTETHQFIARLYHEFIQATIPILVQKMFTRLLNLTIAVCVTVAISATAQAQVTCGNTGAAGTNCTPAGTTATVTVQRVVFMSVAPAAAALTAPTNADFVGGGTTTKIDLAAQAVTVRANATWAMTIKGSAWTGTGNNAKLIADLGWSKTGGAPFTAMTNGAVALNNGAATASTITTLAYQTNWALVSDSPGTYTMALTFTLTAP